jgi:uncharacterized protein (DUF1800 family)
LSLWKQYQPDSSAPWDLKRVVHLHRRTVFGACWKEIQRDLRETPQAAITRVLEGKCRTEGLLDDFESLTETIGNAAIDSANPQRLKAWWIYRCLYSPRPLEERLTLMWHNHFATSNQKVGDLRSMKQQNDTLRKYSSAKFGELLGAMSHDPAILEWLDAPSNRVGTPNENLARELMELFSLGVGNYTEKDVSEAARALTGWTARLAKFRVVEDNHDRESKTILKQTGNWTGDDVVRILLEQKSCAQRIAWRLTNEFFGENVVSDPALNELADGLRERQLDVRWGVETILRSELFFSEANIQTRVSDPVSFLVIPLRAMECWRSSPQTIVLAEWLDKIGQKLFYPPNVGGWHGGRAWLSTRTVIARANYATALTNGQLANPSRPMGMPLGLSVIAKSNERLCALGNLLCGGASAVAIQKLVNESGTPTETGERLQHCVQEFLTQPAAQLH